MKIGVISKRPRCSWAGSEEVWKLAMELALKKRPRGHGVSPSGHCAQPGVVGLPEERRFMSRMGFFFPGAIATMEGRLVPTFPVRTLDRFDVLLLSLGSLPAMNYVPGLVPSLLATKTPIVCLCQFNADHLYFSDRERDAVSLGPRQMPPDAVCLHFGI